jgi:hypothetical protein
VTPSTGRGAPWWQVALQHDGLEALEPGEPWAEQELDGDGEGDGGLSEDQRALLAGQDQPPVPRLRSLET